MANQIGVEVIAVGVAAFSRAMRTAQDDLERFNGATRGAEQASVGLGDKLVSVGGNLQRIGRTLLIDVSAPIAILTGTLLSAGIQFQDSFAGVTKTVDGLAIGFHEIRDAAKSQLGITVTTMDEAREAASKMGMAFGDLTPVGREVRNEFLQMGLEIPIATKDLAALGEVVGQLGVEAPQIAEVTKLISLLGVATDVAAEDAAFGLIRMANIMGSTVGPNAISMEEFIRRAGSTLVDLGNKSVATEKQILDFALRLSAAGNLAGWSEQQVFAWATTLADLGARTESGGTAVSRALNEMTIAVATGSDNLEVFANVMGISSEEFANAFRGDASATLAAFTEALGRGVDAGKVTKENLTEMGLGGIRATDIMFRLSNAQEIFTKNLTNANTAWDEAIALEDEAEKRFNTFKSQLQLLKNAFTDLGVAIFDLVEDDLKKLVNLVKDGISWFKGLDDTVKRNIVKFAAIAAAIGPVLLVVGTLIQMLGTIINAFKVVRLVSLATLGPIGLIGLALLGLVAILSGSNFKLNIDFSSVVDKAKETVAKVVEAFSGIWDAFAALNIPDLLAESGILDSAQTLGETIIGGIIDKINFALQFIQDLAKGFADGFTPFVNDKGPQILRIFKNVREILDDVNQFVVGIGTSIAEAFGIDTAGTGVGEFLGNLAGITFEGILDGLENLTGYLSDLTENLDNIKNSAEVQSILDGISGAIDNISASLEPFISLISKGDLLGAFGVLIDGNKDIAQIFAGVATAVLFAWDVIKAFISSLITTLGPTFSSIFHQLSGLMDDFGITWRDVWEAVKTAVGVVAIIIGGILAMLLGVIVGVVSGIASAIEQIIVSWRSILPHVISAVEGIIKYGVGLYLFFDKLFQGDFPAALLALRMAWEGAFQFMEGITQAFWKGIEGTFNMVLGFISGFVVGMSNFFKDLYNNLVGHSIIPDMINGIIRWFNYFKDAALRPIQWFVDRAREAMWGIQNVLNDVKWAFDLLAWKIGNVVSDAKWYLDQLGSKVQDVLRMITGSPELKLQHPFELFENYLKSVDYGKLLESSMSISMLSQLSAVGPAGMDQGNTTNISRDITANISGVSADTADGIVEILNRQVRMSEVFQS